MNGAKNIKYTYYEDHKNHKSQAIKTIYYIATFTLAVLLGEILMYVGKSAEFPRAVQGELNYEYTYSN